MALHPILKSISSYKISVPVFITWTILLLLLQYFTMLSNPSSPVYLDSTPSNDTALFVPTLSPSSNAIRKIELDYAEKIYQRNLQRRSEHYTSAPTSPWEAKAYWISPLYPCFGEEKVGQWGDGGKWVCRVEDFRAKVPVVYSIGCNGDTSFEYDIWRVLGAKIFTFDPTLKDDTQKEMSKKTFMTFFNIGLTHQNNLKKALRSLPYRSKLSKMMRIGQIMRMLNHTFVDIFKIDCEGCEVGVMKRIHKERPRHKPLFGQILMEVHEFETVIVQTKFLEMMESMGYRLFHAEKNYYSNGCYELAYIHESLLHT